MGERSASLVVTERLELRPLPARAAAALPGDRAGAARSLGAPLAAEWPQPDLLAVLPRQAAASPQTERFGIWVMIERDSGTVVGDIGFHGPADESGSIELGYSVIPARRRRGYATEAATGLIGWALSQPGIQLVVAGCEAENAASIGTLERVGFRRTGEAGGEIRWRFPGGAAAETLAFAGSGDLGELEPLWRSLHAHHRRVAQVPLLADDDLSWQRRSAWYRAMLDAGEAFLLVARDGAETVGYAFVYLRPGDDDTWPVGARLAELVSLAVAPARRGAGIGTRLMDAVDAELERRGIHDLEVAVMAGNARALAFYERRGLRVGEILLFRFGSAS